MKKAITRALMIGVGAPLLLGAAAMAAEKASDTWRPDPRVSCAQMMPAAGITDEGMRPMQEFMQSPRASDAMTSMMAMARRMGNGDVMLGMTRMMEMMGSMGGGMMGRSERHDAARRRPAGQVRGTP